MFKINKRDADRILEFSFAQHVNNPITSFKAVVDQGVGSVGDVFEFLESGCKFEIESLQSSLGAKKRKKSISGRDVNNNILYKKIPPKHYIGNQNAALLVQEFLQNSQITVDISNAPKRILKEFTTQKNESIFSSIDRITRVSGLSLVPWFGGKLSLLELKSPSKSITIDSENEIESISLYENSSERYGKYVASTSVFYHQKDKGWSSQKTLMAEATDTDVDLKKVLELDFTGSILSQESLQNRINFERDFRAMNSKKIEIRLSGLKLIPLGSKVEFSLQGIDYQGVSKGFEYSKTVKKEQTKIEMVPL